MPKVGDKKFAYTEEGMDAAEDYAMETGQEVIPTYDAGGRVERIQGYGDEGRSYKEGGSIMDKLSKFAEGWYPGKKNRKGTSRVTKPEKHKAKGKWFPSAEELKAKKESRKQKKAVKASKKNMKMTEKEKKLLIMPKMLYEKGGKVKK